MGELEPELKKRKLGDVEREQDDNENNAPESKILKPNTHSSFKLTSTVKTPVIGESEKEKVSSKNTTIEEKDETDNKGETHRSEIESKKEPEKEQVSKEEEEEEEEKEKVQKETSNKKDQQKFVFGSTTAFGNMGGFKMLGSGKNVFSLSPSESTTLMGTSEEKKSKTTEAQKNLTKPESTVTQSEPTEHSNKNDKSNEETQDSDTNVANKKPQVFGSGSMFGNAFQAAINKKSVFDELKPHSTQKESQHTVEKDVYKKVHLEKQEVKSGEENEETIFQVNAKLYHMELSKMSLGWKEKGFGVIKVNKFIKSPAENYTSRLVMRQNGNLKLILNLPILNGFQVLKGMPSSLTANKFIRLQVLEAGEPVQYAIKVGQPDNAEKLYDSIKQQIPK